MTKRAALLLLLSACILAGPPVFAGEPADLFLKFPGGGPFGPPMLDPPGTAAIVEYRAIPNIAGLLTNPDELRIDLPGQPPFTVARRRSDNYPWPLTDAPKALDEPTDTPATVYVWSGYDGATEVVLTYTDELVSGYINLGEYRYVLDFRETNGPDSPGQLLTQVDPVGFPTCAVDTEKPKLALARPTHASSHPAMILPDSGTIIEAMSDDLVRAEFGPTVDVLVLYTPAALASVGSVTAVTMRALNSNDQMNEAIDNSDVRNTRVRVVAVEQIAYNENNGVMPDVTRWYGYRVFLRTSPVVDARRDARQADLVVMLIHDNAEAYCGVAYVLRPDCALDDPIPVDGCDVGTAYNNFAFSVVHVGCAQADAIYAHEVGHQFGAEHQPNRAYPGIGSFEWSYGHFVNLVARDVMAIWFDCTGGNCPMQLHFSNPHVNFFGGSGPPTGSLAPESTSDPRYRYSAKTIQHLAQGIANFQGPTAPADRILFSDFEPK